MQPLRLDHRMHACGERGRRCVGGDRVSCDAGRGCVRARGRVATTAGRRSARRRAVSAVRHAQAALTAWFAVALQLTLQLSRERRHGQWAPTRRQIGFGESPRARCHRGGRGREAGCDGERAVVDEARRLECARKHRARVETGVVGVGERARGAIGSHPASAHVDGGRVRRVGVPEKGVGAAAGRGARHA
eukprot:2386139-Prymnesium_polylepis.1